MKKRQLGIVNHSDPKSPRVDLVSKKSFQEDLRLFKDGQRVWLQVENYSPKRSIAQNNLYHMYCDIIADETGQDLDTIKSITKTMFALYPALDKDGDEQVDKNTGEILKYVKDTSKMDKMEMFDLTEKTYRWALEFFGIVLPLPEQQIEAKFKENY